MPVLLYSSLKPEGYFFKGPKLRLRYVIRDGQVEGLKKIGQNRGRRGDDAEVLSEVSSQIHFTIGAFCKVIGQNGNMISFSHFFVGNFNGYERLKFCIV